MSTSPPPSPPASTASSSLPYESFLKLVRTRPSALDAYFGDVGTSITIDSTQATVHCRHLKLGGDGKPRVKDLADRLAQELINYSIPRSQIADAEREFAETGSTHLFSKLHRKAQGLFTDVSNTGEGGELLLYLMTEVYLGLPQLFCKMPLKTNSRSHYQGADGIHASVDPGTGTLALYWGESKLHATPAGAIGECFESLSKFVVAEGGTGAPQKRDLQLLSDNLDLQDPQLELALSRYLNPDDVQFNKLVYRGVALVGFDSLEYGPATPPISEAAIRTALEVATASWHSSVGYHIGKHKLAEIGMELFCVPFPSVEQFRNAFLTELGLA